MLRVFEILVSELPFLFGFLHSLQISFVCKKPTALLRRNLIPAGVAIFIKRSFSCSVVNTHSTSDGRLLKLDLKVCDKPFSVTTIYAPNHNPEQDTYFHQLEQVLDPCVDNFLLGDFNTVFDQDLVLPYILNMIVVTFWNHFLKKFEFWIFGDTFIPLNTVSHTVFLTMPVHLALILWAFLLGLFRLFNIVIFCSVLILTTVWFFLRATFLIFLLEVRPIGNSTHLSLKKMSTSRLSLIFGSDGDFKDIVLRLFLFGGMLVNSKLKNLL